MTTQAQSVLNRKSEIVNVKSATFPIAKQTAHPATYQDRVSRIENPVTYVPIRHFDFCRESSTNRPFLVQTNPILSASGGLPTLYLTKGYGKNAKSSPAKTNPNEPKRTQTKPIRTPFFARYGTPNPKQTQTNPIKLEAKRRSAAGAQRKSASLLADLADQTNPIRKPTKCPQLNYPRRATTLPPRPPPLLPLFS
jgi:hypothetical protein